MPTWAPPPARVRVLGFVPDDDLRALYAGAEVFCLPEPAGGLRPARCSRPWPRARRSSPRPARPPPRSPGDAAVLVDPLDPDALTEALAALLDDPAAQRAPARRPRGPGPAEYPWAPHRGRPRRPPSPRWPTWPRCDRDPPPGRRQPAVAGARRGRRERGVHRAAARGAGRRLPAATGSTLTLFVQPRASPTPTPTWSTAFPTVVAPSRRRAQGRAGRGRDHLAGPAGPAPSGSTCVHHTGGTVPPVRGDAAASVTIHDLQPLRLPRALQPGEADVPAGHGAARRSRRAVAVIVLTEWTTRRRGRAPRRRPRSGAAGAAGHRPVDAASTRPWRRRCATRYGSTTRRSSCTRPSPTPTRTTSSWSGPSPAVAAGRRPGAARAHRRRGRRRGGGAAEIGALGLGRPGAAHRPHPAADLDALFSEAVRPGLPVPLRGLRHPGARGHGRGRARWSPPTPAPCPRWWATPACCSTRRRRRLGDEPCACCSTTRRA